MSFEERQDCVKGTRFRTYPNHKQVPVPVSVPRSTMGWLKSRCPKHVLCVRTYAIHRRRIFYSRFLSGLCVHRTRQSYCRNVRESQVGVRRWPDGNVGIGRSVVNMSVGEGSGLSVGDGVAKL